MRSGANGWWASFGARQQQHEFILFVEYIAVVARKSIVTYGVADVLLHVTTQ